MRWATVALLLMSAGTTVAQTLDPYLWLEDVGGDRALTWVRERNAESQKVLEAEPGFIALRESLRSVQGLPPGSSRNDFYDSELTQLVQDFQRQHRLAIDGVAGVQTQIVLDTMLNATGSPTIVGPVSGS